MRLLMSLVSECIHAKHMHQCQCQHHYTSRTTATGGGETGPGSDDLAARGSTSTGIGPVPDSTYVN